MVFSFPFMTAIHSIKKKKIKKTAIHHARVKLAFAHCSASFSPKLMS